MIAAAGLLRLGPRTTSVLAAPDQAEIYAIQEIHFMSAGDWRDEFLWTKDSSGFKISTVHRDDQAMPLATDWFKGGIAGRGARREPAVISGDGFVMPFSRLKILGY